MRWVFLDDFFMRKFIKKMSDIFAVVKGNVAICDKFMIFIDNTGKSFRLGSSAIKNIAKFFPCTVDAFNIIRGFYFV